MGDGEQVHNIADEDAGLLQLDDGEARQARSEHAILDIYSVYACCK